jgi:UDP-N-acetylmuramoyl-tripeptide--D-alanyl-D-alanine ligase
VRAAIDVLAACHAPRILVLGDMAEVGDQGPQFHAEVGAYARERGLEHLLACGQASRGTAAAFGVHGEFFETVELAGERAMALASPTATVLVKGSRSMRMERIVHQLAATGTEVGGHH